MSLRVLNVAYPFAVVGDDAVGGAEAVLARLDAGLVERGIASFVIACVGSTVKGRLRTVPAWSGVIDEGARTAAWQAHRTALRETLEDERPDVLHLHGLDFASYLPDCPLPTIVTLHLPLAWYPPGILDLTARGVRFVCVSMDQRRRGGPRWAAVPVIENGVPLTELEKRPAPRGDFGLCLGRICPEKGFHLALAAARRAGVPLLLAGHIYPYQAHERYFAEEILPLLDDERRFIGPVAGPTKRSLLRRARFVAVPSLVDETSSLVAMEALANGTPVVARRVGALPEIIEAGRNGWLADDVDDLARAFADVDQLRADDCLAAARARFDVERMVRDYAALYRAVTRESPSLAPVGSAVLDRLAST